jgi:hypothetical protein
MGALMLTMLPDARWPMFRVGQPQDPPGFRLSNDGSAGTPPGDSGVASFGRYLPDNAGPLVPPDPGGPPYASDGGVYPWPIKPMSRSTATRPGKTPRAPMTPVLVTTGPASWIVSSHSSRMPRMPQKRLAQEQMPS